MKRGETGCSRSSASRLDTHPVSFLGSVEINLESTGRFSIPSLWKPSFGAVALLLAGEDMGLEGHLMFSNETFRTFLERRNEDLVKALMHLVEPRDIDKHGRLSLPPRMVTEGVGRLTLLGEGNRIVILPAVDGGMILSEDREILRSEDL